MQKKSPEGLFFTLRSWAGLVVISNVLPSLLLAVRSATFRLWRISGDRRLLIRSRAGALQYGI